MAHRYRCRSTAEESDTESDRHCTWLMCKRQTIGWPCVKAPDFRNGSNPDFLLGGRTSASAECRHWSGRAVRWSSGAILLSVRSPRHARGWGAQCRKSARWVLHRVAVQGRLTNGCALECGVGFRQLRACRRTRPGQPCANRRHHSITSSARASSGGGTVRPSALRS